MGKFMRIFLMQSQIKHFFHTDAEKFKQAHRTKEGHSYLSMHK